MHRMSDMESLGANLRDLFTFAKSKQDNLKHLDSTSSAFAENLQAAIRAFEECREQVAQLALFSLNEGIEDIPSSGLKYLGIDYLTAELLLISYGGDRQLLLQQAQQLFESFLSRLDSYNILTKEERKLYDRFLDNRASFSLTASNNATERRQAKVARFREEKSLETKLEYLRTKALMTEVDDEITRELQLAEIRLFSHKTFPALDVITQENLLLAQGRLSVPTTAASVPPDRQDDGLSKDSYSNKLDVQVSGQGGRGGPLLSNTGRPLQPFTLTGRRTELRNGVFRPGHNLPSMSIAEYLAEERRRGGILDTAQNAGTQRLHDDEDRMEAADAETMKARKWDEFTESNPKGAGNTLNRG